MAAHDAVANGDDTNAASNLRSPTHAHKKLISSPRVGQGGSGEAMAGPQRGSAQGSRTDPATDATSNRGPVGH
eukprot:3496027-Lingulodinium_polyedra.AAC.1